MRTKVILGLAAVCVAGGAFVAGMFVERHLSLFPHSEPNPPALLSPADGAVLKGAELAKPLMWEFSWSKVSGTESYRIQITPGANARPEPPEYANLREVRQPFTDILVEEPGYRCAQLPPPSLLPLPHSAGDLRLKGWMWKVKAQVGGRWSEWSATRTFDVESPAK